MTLTGLVKERTEKKVKASLKILCFLVAISSSLAPGEDSLQTSFRNKVATLEEETLVKMEAERDQGKSETGKRVLTQLFNQPGQPVPGLEVTLAKMEKTSTSQYRDLNYTFELKYSSGRRHFVLLTSRQYSDGKVDYGLAAHSQPVRGHLSLNGNQGLIYRWSFLVFALAVPAFMLAVAAKCFWSRPPWRLFWLLFIFVGIGRIDLNWSTGNLVVSPLKMIFLGFLIHRADATVSLALPLGAFVFLLLDYKRNQKKWVSNF